MDKSTAPQLAAVYAEAAIAWLETQVPQAVIWDEDEGRWDFRPGDEELETTQVAFVLQAGWDGQLSLDHSTEADADDYDSAALRDEIERQMDEEGIAAAFIENLIEHRERLADADADDHQPAREENEDDGDS